MTKLFKLKKFASFFPLKFKMKLTTLFLVVSLFQLQAIESYVQETKVTLNLENVSLESVLYKIESLTKFNFFFNYDEFDYEKIVSVNAKNKRISSILKRLFKDSNISFCVVDRQIVLSIKKAVENSPEERTTMLNQQGFTLHGIVRDSNGEPLPRANIIEKGTTNGTQTNFDGKFSLDVANQSVILVVSYVGFLTKEINVSAQTTIEITLEEDFANLDEIVVVGYGSKKRSDIAGSISQISNEEIARNPTANLSNALVGNATGIIAKQTSGEPGSDGSNILIRGIGTTGDSSPIYVIDGIVRLSRDFSQLATSEIETFSILKDAASAVVFGVRGGNGVVLVTTKRGKAGKMQIGFSSTYGIQERTRDPDFVSSYEFAKLHNEASDNSGVARRYSDDDVQKYLDGSSPDTHPNPDWLSVLDKTAAIRSYNISASGGSEKVQYAASFSFVNQDGIVPSNNFKRYNFRSNIDAAVTNTTKLSFDISGRNEATNNVVSTEVFRWISQRRDQLPIKFSNGGYSSGPAYLTLPENGYRINNNQTFLSRIQIEQQIPFIDGLSIIGIASYDKSYRKAKKWAFTRTPFFSRQSDGTFTEQTAPSSLDQNVWDGSSITLETHLNYKKAIGKSNFTGLLLYTQTKDVFSSLSANRNEFTIGVDELNFGASNDARNNSGFSGASGRQGVVGRFNWSYDDKYSLETSFRADASEQFAPGNRWGFFPSASLSYNISNEPFLQESTTMDLLKLRVSYGVLGNDRLGGQSFLYLQSYSRSGAAVFQGGNVQPVVNEGRLPNPLVTWETVRKLNIGVDASFWQGKLSASLDVFSDKRSDILGQRNLSVPSLLGVGLPVENLAKIDNKGFEIALGHRNRVNEDFSYSMNANLTNTINKVVFIDEPESDNINIRRTGQPLGTQFGLVSLGLFQTQGEVDSAPTQTAFGSTPGSGDVRYQDINGPDGVPDGIIDSFDRTAIGGSNIPKLIFGYNANLNYKNFELSFLLQGAADVDQYVSGEAAWPFFVNNGDLRKNLNRWTPTNTNTNEPRVLVDARRNQQQSSHWIRNASYLRLKNIELAYNLPLDKIKQNFITSARIYINGNNIATWSNIKDYDPETAHARAWNYPQLKIWSIGINVNF